MRDDDSLKRNDLHIKGVRKDLVKYRKFLNVFASKIMTAFLVCSESQM